MRLDVDVEIPFPRERVFSVYRDRLPDLVPYLPNVRGIQTVSRTEEDGQVKLLNRWKGGGDIPAMVRKFISEDLLEWDDHATWDPQQFSTHWRTVVPAFKEAVRAEGVNHFEVLGPDRTRMRISGELEVDATKVKGVPRLLAGTVGPVVEKFLVAAIKPNLVSVSDGLKRYLQANPG